MTECIRKFDEDISIKANKSNVTLLKNEIEDNYMHIDEWNKIDDRFNEF